jgi:flagellar hook assembly protein FlgD
VELKIYDVSGRVVKRFNHLTITPFNQITWDGSDGFGLKLPAGVYFATLAAGTKRWTEKVVKLE